MRVCLLAMNTVLSVAFVIVRHSTFRVEIVMRSTTRSEQHGGVGGKNKRAFWPWKSLSLQSNALVLPPQCRWSRRHRHPPGPRRTVRERPEPKRVVSLGWMTLERRWNRVDSGHWIMNIMYTTDLFLDHVCSPFFESRKNLTICVTACTKRVWRNVKPRPCKFFSATVFCAFNNSSGHALKSHSELRAALSFLGLYYYIENKVYLLRHLETKISKVWCMGRVIKMHC